jgi:hypothetical protein
MTCTHHWTVTSECPMCLRDEIERLRAERDALRRDAARYRIARWWLVTAFASSEQAIDKKVDDAVLREGGE